MEPRIEKLFTEAHHRSCAAGKAEAVMRIWQRRGLAVTDEQQRQILSCTDLTILDRWLDRVVSVASIGELLA